MKKVLIACTGAFHTDGGIAAVNRLVIHAITAEGYSLDILSLVETDSAVDPQVIPEGARVRGRGFSGNKFSFTLAAWWAILHGRYEFVYVDHVNLASILAPLARFKRCRYAVWLHGVEIFPPRPDREGKLGLMCAWKRLANSDFTRASIIRQFSDLPVEVCDLALDPVRHAGLLKQSPSTPKSFSITVESVDRTQSELGDQVILHVGRMVSGERNKGQDSLIRSFPLIFKEHPGVQLVLVGQGNDMPYLKGLALALPAEMRSHIFFPGYAPDDLLDQIYRKCYIFAMPSVGEGFGLVYLEAMSRAKACLGGRVDATPCVVRDGQTGLLVDDPRSPAQVAEALIWFLSHPAETRCMGEAGYELVRTYYLFPHFQERFWKALQN